MCAKGTDIHMCVKPEKKKKQKSQVKYHIKSKDRGQIKLSEN
jgi:hypothetical protein